MIQFKRVGVHSLPLPCRGSSGAAGLDLCAAVDVTLVPGERKLVPTGWSMFLPTGWVGMIRPRSGLALRSGLHVMAGVIDSDYRGEIGVLLVNLGDDRIMLAAGDRVAQMVVTPCATFPAVEVGEIAADSARGAGGWGSTGVKAVPEKAAGQIPSCIHGVPFDSDCQACASVASRAAPATACTVGPQNQRPLSADAEAWWWMSYGDKVITDDRELATLATKTVEVHELFGRRS